MAKPLRLCGEDCPTPELPHREPEPDWIGDFPVMHGESERKVPGTEWHYGGRAIRGTEDAYCLCGHPNYLLCPETFGEGSVLGVTLAPPEDEAEL